MNPQIAVFDFGSQYTHLIVRRIRQLGVLAKIYSPNTNLNNLHGVKGFILSGGPQSVYDKRAISFNEKILTSPVPKLGLCYGHQLLVHFYKGTVRPGITKEYGLTHLHVTKKGSIFSGLRNVEQVWMSHGDSAVLLPEGFELLAKSFDCPIAAMGNESKKIYGLQFHPEVAHTTHGMKVLRNFVFDICQCKKNWSLDHYFKELIVKIKKDVGKRKVFLLVSGGVDSTVAFALLEKILGKKKVFGLHIDNGFLRKDESAQIRNALREAGFDNLKVVDASEVFLDALKKIIDPEQKRKVIGSVFLQVKDLVMKGNSLDPKKWILGQGTIYPDTIETGGSKHADIIKTHHNRVQEILKLMKAKRIIEPLSELYKDEVRALGQKLGISKKLLQRHPFPGPGLSIRTLCSSGQEKIIQRKSLEKRLQKIVGSQYSSKVLPLRSVGVQGDNRTYRHPALLSGNYEIQKLRFVSGRIANEIFEVNRVLYLASPKKIHLQNLKTKKLYLEKERLDLLRRVDEIVHNEICNANIYNNIWQFPVILAPLTLRGGQTVILRPVQSEEAMTVNFYEFKKRFLFSLAKKISALEGIDCVLYDITNKPPATIEWE